MRTIIKPRFKMVKAHKKTSYDCGIGQIGSYEGVKLRKSRWIRFCFDLKTALGLERGQYNSELFVGPSPSWGSHFIITGYITYAQILGGGKTCERSSDSPFWKARATRVPQLLQDLDSSPSSHLTTSTEIATNQTKELQVKESQAVMQLVSSHPSILYSFVTLPLVMEHSDTNASLPLMY